MNGYYLGADVGSTHTRVLVADEHGNVVSYGEGGPGNQEVVGYDGLARALGEAAAQALAEAEIDKGHILGAGFGVSGYDWPSDREATLEAIRTLGLEAPMEVVNDTLLGLLAGSSRGWGIVLISGSGCNCRGWDRDHQRQGRVTGVGPDMGEGAGGSELMRKVRQALAYQWTQRGPVTALTPLMLEYAGAPNLPDLIEGLVHKRYRLGTAAAPLVFQAAQQGDQVALDLLRWAGEELAELVKAVVRQLDFQELDFDVVMSGGMFAGGALLIEPLKNSVHRLAPGARFVRLESPPVVGAVLLGMKAAGKSYIEARQKLKQWN